MNNQTSTKTVNQTDQARIEEARKAIFTVADPEIPMLSIVDLGIVADVRIENDNIVVDITPTFAGCPALDTIKNDIREALQGTGEVNPVVNTVFNPAWNTDMITDNGRKILKEFGLAPPGDRCASDQLPDIEIVACPFCDSKNTDLESIFGPTLCRSIHYCKDCLQSFEHFKSV